MEKIKTIIKISCILCGLMIQLSAFAHVNLKSPKGGETFHPGESVKIEWEVAIQHDTENWDLYFSSDGGKTYEAIKLDINVKTLSYDWTVPYTTTKEAQIKIVQDNTGGDYSDASGNFTIAGTSTASDDVLKQSGIRLFPNPSSDRIQISSSSLSPPIQKVGVLDNTGRVMNSKVPVMEDAPNQYQLDVSQWPAGIYYMIIQIGDGVEVRQFIVQ